jgi:hypothetical protein
MKGILHENLCKFVRYWAEFFLEREVFQIKVVEKIKTQFLCSITIFRKSCSYWDDVEKCCRTRQATDDNIIRRMRFAFCIIKATDTHSEYVILIVSPRRKWLRERSPMLYVHCVSCCRMLNLVCCTGSLKPMFNCGTCWRKVSTR